MICMMNFEMLRPKTLEEALRMLTNNEGSSVPKSGGTDLLVWMKKRTIHPEVLVDLSRIKELHQLEITRDGNLSIGTNVTLNEIDTFLREQEILSALSDACESHSDYTLRNKATLVGNVCASVPSGDMIPALCCHDAIVEIVSEEETRQTPVLEFITGPKKNVLNPNEIVRRVLVPLPEVTSTGCYLKSTRRSALDLAQASVACVILCENGVTEYRISCGAVSPRPLRVTEAEKLLRGKSTLSSSLIEHAAELAVEAVNPITDVRSSREYRLEMIRELTKRSLILCQERFKEVA